MIEKRAQPTLAPVLCALCGQPVAYSDPTVPRALAGGTCRHCTRGKGDQKVRVMTFVRYVERSPETSLRERAILAPTDPP